MIRCHYKLNKLWIILLILINSYVNAQEKFEPTVLYLYPNEVVMSDDVKKELEAYNKETQITDELKASFVQPGLSSNWKMIREKELEFIQKQDFAALLVISLSRELAYKELEYHPNLLIFPVKETSISEKASYKKMADKFNMSWLVNIPRIELVNDDSGKHLRVQIQLYNTVSGWIFIDTTYSADSAAVKDCDDDGWFCLLEKVKVSITHDVADRIDKNRFRHK